MAINLSGVSAASRAQQHRDRVFTQGILVALGILLLTAGAYFALRVHHETIKESIVAEEGKIALREAEISSQATVKVIDTLWRIEDAQMHEVPRSVELDILENITAHIMSDVWITGYTYAYDAAASRKTVTVDAMTTEFLAIARQIEKLKQAELFSDIAVSDVNRDVETQNLRFTLTMVKDVPRPAVTMVDDGAPQL